jgi:DNA invertase Pin-like site-specific DNA recombinase
MKWIEEQSIEFSSKSENIDLKTPNGRMVLGILASIAMNERETILERTREGRLSKAYMGYIAM